MKAWGLILLLLTASAAAAEPGLTPPRDAHLPLDLTFRDETGQAMTLRQALDRRPAVLVFADWTCSSLCGTTLGAAASILPLTGLRAGRDYVFLAVGLDPRDSPRDAAAMKALHLSDDPALRDTSHFLSGDAASVRAATEAFGFQATYLPEQDQFSHPAALLILASDGRLVHVLPSYMLDETTLLGDLTGSSPQDSLVRRVLLMCHAVLSQGATPWVRTALMVGGAVTVMALAGSLLLLHRRRDRP